MHLGETHILHESSFLMRSHMVMDIGVREGFLGVVIIIFFRKINDVERFLSQKVGECRIFRMFSAIIFMDIFDPFLKEWGIFIK